MYLFLHNFTRFTDSRRDIAEGEELCFDYAGVGSVDAVVEGDEGCERTPCLCGAKKCRQFLPCQNVQR